jgi:hypothetical protein
LPFDFLVPGKFGFDARDPFLAFFVGFGFLVVVLGELVGDRFVASGFLLFLTTAGFGKRGLLGLRIFFPDPPLFGQRLLPHFFFGFGFRLTLSLQLSKATGVLLRFCFCGRRRGRGR